MSDVEPWTIERISDALGNPALRQRFLGEINKAPIHELTLVFAKWQGIAEQLQEASKRGRELHAQRGPDGELPGEWIDVTDELRERAARLQARGAA